ncbi:MAG TPA: energy transducer TonB [Deltaproteobacteria bacterium]|nr:energy transducer TonB [Deltaproteobacteria bacterium]
MVEQTDEHRMSEVRYSSVSRATRWRSWMMRRRRLGPLAILCGATSLFLACQTRVPPPSEIQSIQTAHDAYRAYERGDCDTALALSDPRSLDLWPFNEVRHSMLLLHGFCLELEGRKEDAKDIYRRILVEIPDSWAASDARERLHALKQEEADPDRARRAEAARKRRESGAMEGPGRTPIERVPAEYPPLARATGLEGYVVVEFGISRSGDTVDPIIVESSPPFIFDGASLRAVRRWLYTRGPAEDADRRQWIRIVFKNKGYPDSPARESSPPEAPADS